MPSSEDAARVIADLAAAIASGSADALQAMASPRDQTVLGMLVQNGQWKRQADAVKVVRVCVVNEPSGGGFQVGFGVEDAAGAFLMGWEATGGGASWTVSNMPIEPRLASTAAGLDGAELKLLALPSGLPAPTESMTPVEEKKEESEEKKAPRKTSSPPPGTLRRERI
jgi:hypothetical protein